MPMVHRSRMPVFMRAAVLASLALAAGTVLAQGDAFPSKLVRIVVPYPAGGSADVMARDIADGLGKVYKHPVVVENKPGAGGHIGAEYVLAQPADGHTLVLATISHNGAFKMYKKLRYDPAKDLQPVVLLSESLNVLMVRESLPVKNVQELIAMARAQPGKLTYASAGSGSATHMAAELFKHMAKVDMLGIPFKGGAPAQTALLGGQVDVNFETGNTAKAAISTGKVRALAVTSPEPSPSYPGLPTVAATVPGYASVPWYTISTRSGVPAPVVAKLNADINAALKSPQLAKRWEAQGLVILGGSAEDAKRRNAVEFERWTTVIEAANIRVE
jgi:tripartite-type tricarboxylate transporter receptor subunit TctC